MKQKQWEHFEHLGLFIRVVIGFFKMRIRDCNKPGGIDVVTNDREWCGVLQKMPFGALSILGTVSTNADQK